MAVVREPAKGWIDRYVIFTDGVRSEHSYCNACDEVVVVSRMEIKQGQMDYTAVCQKCGAKAV